jgi:hypothetical protein
MILMEMWLGIQESVNQVSQPDGEGVNRIAQLRGWWDFH